VGLSTGLTAKLGEPAKIAVMAGMFLGRIGPMTLMLALTARGPCGRRNSYLTENVLVA
jgi:Trk-type K+ transport system membrane component